MYKVFNAIYSKFSHVGNLFDKKPHYVNYSYYIISQNIIPNDSNDFK